MGKHTALDEDVVHPLVAEALRRRSASGAPNVVASLPVRPASGTAVGWPAEPGRGEGLGWPGDPQPAREAAPEDDGSLLAVLDAAAEAEVPQSAEQPRRTGWRRFFGGGHTSTRSGTSAA